MKIKLVALTLIAFVCWLVPIKTLAQETDKTETKVEQVASPENVTTSHPLHSNTGQPRTNQSSSDALSSRSNRLRPATPIYNGGYGGRHYSTSEVIQLIKDYSAQYEIPADIPLCIAKAESGYNHLAMNRSSSASGVFQYLSGTWRGTDEGKSGLSVFDADANVRAAIKYMASRRSTLPWEVRNKCPQF